VPLLLQQQLPPMVMTVTPLAQLMHLMQRWCPWLTRALRSYVPWHDVVAEAPGLRVGALGGWGQRGPLLHRTHEHACVCVCGRACTCLCVCACECCCVFACICVCVCLCVYACMHPRVYVLYVCACVHMSAPICHMHACTRECMCCTNVRACTCLHQSVTCMHSRLRTPQLHAQGCKLAVEIAKRGLECVRLEREDLSV